MDWEPKDWIEHPTYGVGQVSENRDDKLDIDFVGTGRKTLLKSTELKAAIPPSSDFKFPSAKGKSRTPRFKVQHPPKQPPLDFNDLVEGFVRFFDGGGFDSNDFDEKERKEKRKAAGILKEKLGKEIFESLLRDGRYVEVCDVAKEVLQKTRLVFRIEKAKFVDGLKVTANHERFAKIFFDLLHGPAEMEQRFNRFCDLLSEMGANKWTIATYYQFLATDGKWMFMKPKVMRRMADSLKISLEYKPGPNWRTYFKLQELADCVEKELRNRGLETDSRIDVQGFVWASIKIADGRYGKKGSPHESDEVGL
jgi:hypothetical protein